MTTQMIITRLTKPQLIGWQMGVRGFLTLDERYEIEPIAHGVSIHHSVECRCIFGGLVGLRMPKGMRGTTRLTDAALLHPLLGQSGPPGHDSAPNWRPIKPPPPPLRESGTEPGREKH